MSRPVDPAVEAATTGRVVAGRAKPPSRQPRSRRPQQARAPPDVDAYSVPEFCRRHGISVAFFHKLKVKGLAPPVMKVGARVLVSHEAATNWRRARERASQV
jgi:hypothetical protein